LLSVTARVANERKNRIHQVTAKRVDEHRLIVTEDLSIRNMTACTQGTAEKPGENVKQKVGFNRWLNLLGREPAWVANFLPSRLAAGRAVVHNLRLLSFANIAGSRD
jgi:hypothetical protein